MGVASGAMTALLHSRPGAKRAPINHPFAYTYLTEVLPQGGMEIEQWLTWKHKSLRKSSTSSKAGRNSNTASAIVSKARFISTMSIRRSSRRGPGRPTILTTRRNSPASTPSLSIEVRSPFTDPFGFALYFEPSIGDGERALELKLLFQKNFLEDRLIFATNFILEYEWEHEAEEDIWEHASAFEITVALAYRVAPGWFAGVEFLNENEYAEHIFSGAHAEVSKFYFGPTIHYATQDRWATLGFYKQLPGLRTTRTKRVSSRTVMCHDAERTRLRFRLGHSS